MPPFFLLVFNSSSRQLRGQLYLEGKPRLSGARVSRVKVSRVTAGYGIEAAIVYFQREEQIYSRLQAQINDLRWLSPPSRLEMQLLQQDSSSSFAKWARDLRSADW
jgi:hypothetical protein